MTPLRFGPGGFPTLVKGQGVLSAINWCKENGLGVMEMEFVHSTWLKGSDKIAEVREAAKRADVHLTAHGSYYINLNSDDAKKREASVNRILSAAYATAGAGGKSVTFHPAFYKKTPPQKVYETVKGYLKDIVSTLRDEGHTVRISPETTGKASQFGTYQELCRLASELEGVGLCVDFAHLHARSGGEYNTYEEFSKVLETVEEHLGREGLDEIHIHMSGIEYGDKGEKHHLPLDESDMNYPDLLRALKEYRVGGWVISESPLIEADALLMQRHYRGL
jgi:deoxyribonuclease IV